MLYNKRIGLYNSITQNINDSCVYWTIVNSIIGCFVLYYCILALCALLSSSIDVDECSPSLLFILVCMTIIVSIGLFVSTNCYRINPTKIRFALCILCVLSIFGVYSLLFMEMSDKCAIENIHYKNTNDLYSISWIWINLVSFIIFISFISTGIYIVYEMSYKDDTFTNYKHKKDDILHLCTFKTPINSAFMSDKGHCYHALEKCEGVRIERKRDLCDIQECNGNEM